jgi:hypothetical protein
MGGGGAVAYLTVALYGAIDDPNRQKEALGIPRPCPALIDLLGEGMGPFAGPVGFRYFSVVTRRNN